MARLLKTPTDSYGIHNFEMSTRSMSAKGDNFHMTYSPLKSKMEATMMSHSNRLDSTRFHDGNATNITCLLDENPQLASGCNLYSEFLEAVQLYPQDNQVLDLLATFHQNCAENVQLLRRINLSNKMINNDLGDTKSLMDLLDLEKHTWALLLTLYKDRFDTEMKADEEMGCDISHVDYSEREIITLVYERDVQLRETQLIVDWLEGINKEAMEASAETDEQFASQTVIWENTRYRLTLQTEDYLKKNNIMLEMHPDAPLEGKGGLVDQDKQDEERFLRYLFQCVRAGDLEKAQRLCIESGQAWRAAELDGWRLYHDPQLAREGQVSNSGEDRDGNPNRSLYKTVCWLNCQDERLPLYERGLLAAYTGNLGTLLLLCSTWEDVLWAHSKAMVESRVDAKVRHFTEKGPWKSQSVMGCLADGADDLPEAAWIPGEWTPSNIFHHVEATLAARGKRQQPNLSTTIFRSVQKAAILSDVEELIVELHSCILSLTSVSKSGPLRKHLLRFIAHLVLFLRKTHPVVDHEKCALILEAYVECLIQDRDVELIAFYAATLPSDLQVTNYAMFLEGITETEERAHCLQLGQSAGLNITRIASLVVSRIRTRAPVQPGLTPGPTDPTVALQLPGEKELQDMLTTEEWNKIHSIDWLVLLSDQKPEALRQTNCLSRLFIVFNKINGIKEVIKRLPVDILDQLRNNFDRRSHVPQWQRNVVKEHEGILEFLEARESYANWFTHFHHNKPAPLDEPSTEAGGRKLGGSSLTEKIASEQRVKEYRDQMDRWRHVLELHTKSVCTKILSILECPSPGWLLDDQPWDPSEDELSLLTAQEVMVARDEPSRRKEIHLVRRECIRSLTFLLVSALLSSGQYTQCLRVADLIASEDQKHYELFRPVQMSQLIAYFREASLALLDQNLDPLGYKHSR